MILQLAFVLTAIIIGARLGGIGLGVMGGVGLAILTFVFGLQPTAPTSTVLKTASFNCNFTGTRRKAYHSNQLSEKEHTSQR